MVSTVTATLKMFDAMTRPLQNITNSMNLMLRSMEDMQRATNKNVNMDRTLTAAKRQLAIAESEIRRSIEQNTQAQQRFNNEIKKTNDSANNLTVSVKKWAAGLAAAYLTAQGIRNAIESSDLFISTQARMDLIVDEGQSVDELQKMIYAASQRARGDFNAMADNVSRLGLLARDAFESTAELVAFTEIMQKAFKVSGASITEQSAAMYQLSQAMAAGRLQGDEFVSIMENAPMLAAAMADYLGVSRGELKELSSEGKLTADVIKGALFAAAEDINAKFEQLPMTFGDMFQKFKNEAFMAFEPVFKRMNEWLNSTQGATVIQSITNAIYFAAQAANVLMSMLIWVGDAIHNNWAFIEPFLIMIGSVLLVAIISAIWSMVAAVLAAAKAWLVLNWPILLIGSAIGLLIYIIYRWGNVVEEVIGFVVGLFTTLFAFMINNLSYVANIFLSVAEFFLNVWRNPVAAVQKLFYDMVINILKYMENLAKGIENIINSIPGIEISITSGLSNLLGRLEKARDNLTSEAELVQLMRFEQLDYSQAFNYGRELGRSIGRFASDGIQNAVERVGGMFDPQMSNEMIMQLDNIDKIGKVDSIGKIDNTVDISSEDLKAMRELAEMRNIQNFVTLTPTVSVLHTGDVNSGYDIETITTRITERLETEIASSARGVFGV